MIIYRFIHCWVSGCLGHWKKKDYHCESGLFIPWTIRIKPTTTVKKVHSGIKICLKDWYELATVFMYKMNDKPKHEERPLNDLEAQLLLERISTRGYVPPQELYDRYVQYLIRKPDNDKAHYPLTESEVTEINKYKRGKSTTSQRTTRAAPFTPQPPFRLSFKVVS